MKKRFLHKGCYTISVLCMVGLIIKLIYDYTVYSSSLNSAPFWVWIAVDCLYFLPVAVIFCVIGFLLQKRSLDRSDKSR